MPMSKHVKTYFVGWLEKKVSEKQHRLIDQHLENCDGCRTYFSKMSILLEPSALSGNTSQEPDPSLPTRIKAMIYERKQRSLAGAQPRWLRWSFAGGALLLALGIGIFLGKGLSARQNTAENTDFVSDYYEAFSQNGFADHWVSAFDTNRKDTK